MGEKTSSEFNELVVVGSSAGGIEALSILVNSLPKDFPAPIVLAQHLDPFRPSNLEHVLERRSALPIVVAQDGARLEVGKVYVTPANRHVAIRDGLVRLEDDHGARPRPSVDLLLSSAAESYGDRLIAVILTGSGSDGAAGAIDVKKAGGTVIIQNPRTARYPSMPMALPPTAVDHIADIEQMGSLIYDLAKGVDLPKPQEKVEDTFREVLLQINRQVQIDFRRYKPTTILRRIARRMAVMRIANLSDYSKYLEGHPEEMAELVMSFLIKVTEFFRDAQAFAYLKKNILPRIIERARTGDKTLRFWSAGCATGEEPYTLALLVADLLGAELPQWSVKIFATDLDEGAINFAQRGLYPPNVLENLPDDYRDRFFEKIDHGYRVSKNLRQMVIFGHQDLSRGVPFPRIDLVVCRNLLIYFNAELQQHVLDLFAFSLHHTNGYLFLGKAETVRPSQSFYEQIDKRLKIFRCMRSPRPDKNEWGIYAASGSWMSRYDYGEAIATRTRRVGAPEKEAPARNAYPKFEIDLVELRRYNELVYRFLPYGVVIIDRNYRILTANGNARRLLIFRDLAHNQDFLHTARILPYEKVRMAIDTVFRERSMVTLPNLAIDSMKSGDDRYLSLRIAPMQIEHGPMDMAIITIEDVTEEVRTHNRLEEAQTKQERLVDDLTEANTRLNGLNKELQDVNEELQAANEGMILAQEELQSTNEELEATNEEFQAMNEELETTNEELQATNEELETTNEELTERGAELMETGKSLADERIRLTEMIELSPFYIMLLRGPGLLIEAFNGRSAGLLGGREVIGRSFAEIFREPEMAELVCLAREAYSEDQSRTTSRIRTRLPDERGKMTESYFVYTVVPRHDSEAKVDGLVIYAEDVTALRAREAAERLQHLKLMVENAEQVALGLFDAETTELLQASPRYLDKIEHGHGYARDRIVGRKWRELTFTDPDEAIEMFNSVVETGDASGQVEIRVKLGGVETIWSRTLTPIRFAGNNGTDKVSFILFSAVEVTEQVHAREQLERLDFLKDQFLSLASHELRTPLVPLAGYSEALIRLVSKPPAVGKEVEQNQRILQMVNKFRGQIKHLVRLTDDLLDVSRLQSGKFSLRNESVSLTRVVEQAIEEARLVAPERVIRLAQMEKDRPLMVRGDEERLLQALNNILHNAIKHAPQSDRIDVRLSRADIDGVAPHAQIEVRDYGPGIAPENLGMVFNRFNQLSVDGGQPSSGLGLGLYIAKGIIEQHGGAITVQSILGEGSAFVIRLPLMNEDVGTEDTPKEGSHA
jgi:two-component system, chemotaxis family, CheB/CheR fusion protein